MKKITFILVCLLTLSFANAQYSNMAIVGDGAGGWPTGAAGEVDAKQMTTTDGGVTWTYDNLVTAVGSVKFRVGNVWNPTANWGGNTFLSGTGIVDGPGIPSVVGIYDVTFNSTTLAYTFVSQNLYPTISLVGPGIANGSWDTDTDMITVDGITYTVKGVSLKGAVKFRQDHAWTNNWGGSVFPAGTATFDTQDAIDVPEGIYNVTFNKTTLAYSFAFPTIALVGDATPQGWPKDPQVDQHVLTTTDGITYTLNSIALKTGPAKFRQDNAWVAQWGAGDADVFPTGMGTQDGKDIAVVAGTYSITLNKNTGAYKFANPVAAATNFNKLSVKVYPNPAQSVWNFVSESDIQSIEITDIFGKNVLTVTQKNKLAAINISGFSNGMYFARIVNDNSFSNIKLLKN